MICLKKQLFQLRLGEFVYIAYLIVAKIHKNFCVCFIVSIALLLGDLSTVLNVYNSKLRKLMVLTTSTIIVR